MPGVTAVVPTLAPRPELGIVLDELAKVPVDEVLVVENGPNPVLESRDDVRILRPGRNLGIAARNLAAREAAHDLLLMMDRRLAGPVEYGAMNRSMGRAAGRKIVSILYPTETDAAERASYCDQVWNGQFVSRMPPGRSICPRFSNASDCSKGP